MLYDTVIIGSGYTALGYAIANGNTLIIEAREALDTCFCLSARRFALEEYTPKTLAGEELSKKLSELGLISNGMMNATALEVAISALAIEHNLKIYLKARVIGLEDMGDRIRLSVISNAGIEHYFARRVLDMKATGDKIFTLIFESGDGDNISSISGFDDSTIEPAFYKNRYALHTKVYKNVNYTDALVEISERFEQNSCSKKMLYAAPVFGYERCGGDSDTLTDSDFNSPIAAIDYGYTLGFGGAL